MAERVDHAGDAELAVDSFKTRKSRVVRHSLFFLGFLLLVALESVVVNLGRLFTVAVVGLVVEYEDVFESHEIGHDALNHLALGF